MSEIKEYWIDGDTLFCNTVFTTDESDTPIQELPDEKRDITKSFYDMNEIWAANHAGKKGETSIRSRSGTCLVIMIPFTKFCDLRKEWQQLKK